MSYRTKGVISIMFLALLSLASAGNYTLGSHQVTFNVSEPYNSTAKLDPPVYMSDSDSWVYNLNMTPDAQHQIIIRIHELSIPIYGSKWVKDYVEVSARDIKDNGIGGYKFSSMDFKGYPAYRGSYPEQTVFKMINKEPIKRSEWLELAYQIDEKTIVFILVLGSGIPYPEIFDTIEVIEAPTKPTKYAPYISQKETKSFIGPTSAYAGPGEGAKPGMENQNGVTVLGDAQSSNITVTAHGVK